MSATKHQKEIGKILGFSNKQWEEIIAKDGDRYENMDPEQAKLYAIRMNVISNRLGIKLPAWKKLCTGEPVLITLLPETIMDHINQNATVMNVSREKWIELCRRAPRLFSYSKETLTDNFKTAISYLNNPKSVPADVVQAFTPEQKIQFKEFAGIAVSEEKYKSYCTNNPQALSYTPEKMLENMMGLYSMFKGLGFFKKKKITLSDFSNYLTEAQETVKMRHLYWCHQFHQTGEKLNKSQTFQYIKKGDVMTDLNLAIKNETGMIYEEVPDIIKHYPCPFMLKLQKTYQRS